jgi:transcriptional regulator with XRE-family HTH domain
MKERLLEFLRAENKSSAQFAEEIGVQPSGISHILSGRNNPSLDFVLKMLEKYKFISTDWLLFGKGSMYKEPRMQTLFDEENILNLSPGINVLQKETAKSDQESRQAGIDQPDAGNSINLSETRSSIARIVWFYVDNSFEEFFPRQ